MRSIYAISVVLALSTPTTAQTLSSKDGVTVPRSGVLKPDSSAEKHIDGIDGRAPLPCDGMLDQNRKCVVRFSGSHAF